MKLYGSMRGNGVVKSARGTDKSGLGFTVVADGLCLEVQTLIIGGNPMFQVSLMEKPGDNPRYVKMLTKGNL